MSAIVGLYYLDRRPVESHDISRMVDVLAHRGPDGAKIWCDGAIGLGHCMLWTTPESIGEQLPLHRGDRKSTRLNSSHLVISYAVFCLKKKKTKHNIIIIRPKPITDQSLT